MQKEVDGEQLADSPPPLNTSNVFDSKLSVADEFVPFVSREPKARLPSVLSPPHQPKKQILETQLSTISNSWEAMGPVDERVNEVNWAERTG